MKKKITTVVAFVLVAVVSIVGTMAYMTSTDKAVNTFTVGNVKIDLTEPSWEDGSLLVPGDNKTNTVKKDPTVTNTGSQDAYVRVQFAIPSALVDKNINAYNDMIHVNFTADSARNPYWSWHPTYTTGDGWTDNGLANNNTYTTKIGNEDYTVWVVTYRTALKPGEATAYPAFFQVYLDKHVEITEDKGVYTYDGWLEIAREDEAQAAVHGH